MAIAGTAHSANVMWLGGSGGLDFADGANWDGGVAPGSGDIAFINVGDGVIDYAYLDTATEVQRFLTAETNGTTTGGLEIRSGGLLTTNSTGSSYIGARDNGYLRVMPGGELDLAGDLQVGWSSAGGMGFVTQTGGIVGIGEELVMGSAVDTVASYELSQGTLNIANYLQVGRQGSGTFEQTGGVVNVNRPLESGAGLVIGSSAGGVGSYTISGGNLTTVSTLTVGTLGVVSDSTFTVVGSTPTINVGGSYEQSATSTLAFDIAGGVSPLSIAGDATVNGALDVSFSVNPTPGSVFPLLNYTGSLTGAFTGFDSLVDSPAGADTVQLAIDYGTGTNSTISVSVIQELGDFNFVDGVTIEDFLILSGNLAAELDGPVAYTDGDIDSDGDIDLDDFGQFKALYPAIVAAALGQGQSVPEPSSAVLVVALIGLSTLAIRNAGMR